MALEKVGEALVQSQVRFNRVPKKVWCRARSGSIGFRRRPEKVWEALVQSQLRKVPEKSGSFGAEPGKVQQGSGEGSGEGFGRLWC